jgi:glycosyltransferase involved in cell wall biosynthesis
MRRQVAPSDIAATFRLMREVRSLAPDILHGHGAKGGAYARVIGTLLRASGSRVARIYTPHGGSLHSDPKALGGRVYFAAERLLETMTDAFIFVSRYEAETYAAKVGKPFRPARVVLNGLRPEEFEPVEPGPEARDFLFIGTLRDLKGPDVFIAALGELGARANTPPPTAWIVGAGDDKPRYAAMVAALHLGDRITFRDPMPARDAFALARAVVVPSRAESMPYIVLETVAAALPIIASRVGGIPEILGEEHMVPPGDPAHLADAMAAIRADWPAARASALGLRERIRSVFSVEAMAEAVIAVYRSVTTPVLAAPALR